MNREEALLDGDFSEFFDEHPDIIFYENKVDFPKKKSNAPFPARIAAFVQSKLFTFLTIQMNNQVQLTTFCWDIKGILDKQANNDTSPIFIGDVHGNYYFIDDEREQLFFSTVNNSENSEIIVHRLEKAFEKMDDIIVIRWDVYNPS